MLFKEVTLTIGMFTTGHSVYWSQMPDIKQEIENYAGVIENRLANFGKVINVGIVDNIAKARATDELFARNNVDLIIIHAGTYGLSKNILPCLRSCRVPILTLHLQPVDSFSSSSTSAVTLPKNAFSVAGEVGSVLKRAGIGFRSIAGRLYGDDRPWRLIQQWCEAVKIKKGLKNANIGIIGNAYSGMCDIYVDELLMINKFGINLEIFEPAELRKTVESVSDEEVVEKMKFVKDRFALDSRIGDDDLQWSCKVAAGMEKLAQEYDLDGLAYHYYGYPGSEDEKIASAMTLGGTLLTGSGIPCAAEGDVLTTVAMVMISCFGNGASQVEVNVADFNEDIVYIAHSGPGDFSIAQGKPFLKWLDFFHGKKGNGISCQFSMKNGPITLVSLTQTSDRYKMILIEGESVSGPILNTGNVNTRVRFQYSIDKFVEHWTEAGPTHHSVICLGHQAERIKKLAAVLDLDLLIF